MSITMLTDAELGVCSFMQAWAPGLMMPHPGELVRPTFLLLASEKKGALNGCISSARLEDEEAARWLVDYFALHSQPGSAAKASFPLLPADRTNVKR